MGTGPNGCHAAGLKQEVATALRTLRDKLLAEQREKEVKRRMNRISNRGQEGGSSRKSAPQKSHRAQLEDNKATHIHRSTCCCKLARDRYKYLKIN